MAWKLDPEAPIAEVVTLLDQTQARTMWTRDGRQLTSVTYQVRNNRKQYLRLTMPEGAGRWSAAVGGRAVQPLPRVRQPLALPLQRDGGPSSICEGGCSSMQHNTVSSR